MKKIEISDDVKAALVLQIVETLGIETELAQVAVPVIIDNLLTLERKQRDYGSGNLLAFGEFGVLVRLNDKVARMRNLLQPGAGQQVIAKPNFEPTGDSWLDSANYGLIGYLIHEGKFPRQKEQK